MLKIKFKQYSCNNVLVIAELGTSHNGDIVKAKEMIDAAACAGADCVKVQIVFAQEILHPATGFVPLPQGNTPLFDVFKKLEAGIEFYAGVKTYTESKGLLFLATPFGEKSAALLKNLKPDFVKVASPELNYVQLLQAVKKMNVPVLLSSGVSKLQDIERALEIFLVSDNQPTPQATRHGCSHLTAPRLARETLSVQKVLNPSATNNKSLCLLHCITAYPAPETEYNLNVLHSLKSIFGVSVGISDHSADPVLVPVLSVACGAAVIEKHFCLSNTDKGLDDPIALPPDSFSLMCRSVRYAQNLTAQTIIHELSNERGADIIQTVLGDGVKKLAASEKANYDRTNRSIHALNDIKAGDRLTEKNIAILRTEKILRPGLPPYLWDTVIGRRARNFIPSGEGVRLADI
ncbi:spore coat protein [Spirochaetia bacterium]|nr:spore coat protein [Spirochaetia bacterium]